MTCIEAEPYVSAVCDGEPIPLEGAEHISTCTSCRATMAEYARIGTELRMTAAMDSRPVPGLELPPRRRVFDFVWHRVQVPRFALAALIVAVIVAGVSVRLVSAQQKPLWFQFGYTLDPDETISTYQVAKAGFDQPGGMMMMVHGAPLSLALRIKVESVSADDVVLRCRAVSGKMEVIGNTQTWRPRNDLPLNGAPAVHYRPGQQLAIPIEGGGSVYLKGDVYDQQPKIAFGVPLEPPSDQLSMRGPVLISGDRVLAELSGGGATAQTGWAVILGAGNDGTFHFALRPFAGSVQGQMEWGQMTFTLDGRPFHLVAAGPLATGEQPRPVWVRNDPTPAQGKFIGTARLTE